MHQRRYAASPSIKAGLLIYGDGGQNYWEMLTKMGKKEPWQLDYGQCSIS